MQNLCSGARERGCADGINRSILPGWPDLPNVYVTGQSSGSGSSYDYATIKYNSVGQQQWIAYYDGPIGNTDSANAIAVDQSDNVYVTGERVGSRAKTIDKTTWR